MRSRPSRWFWVRLAASLVLAAAVVVPAAIALIDAAERRRTVQHLGSTDPTERERALNTLIREAPQDRRLAAAVVTRFPTLPADAVWPTVRALDVAGLWETPGLVEAVTRTLPRLDAERLIAAARWLPDPEAGFDVAEDRLDDDRLPEAERAQFLAWLSDEPGRRDLPAVVRYRVERDRWAEDPVFRRRAARTIANHADRGNRDFFDRVLLELVADPAPMVRAAALSGIAGRLVDAPELTDTMRKATKDVDPKVSEWAERLLDVHESRFTAVNFSPEPHADFWQVSLTEWERRAPGSVEIDFTREMPHLLRPTAVVAATTPSPDWVIDTLRLDGRPAARDRACLAAVRRFDGPDLDALIEALITGHDPEGRMSAAALAGLSGRWGVRLAEAISSERDPAVRRVVAAGAWMVSPVMWPAEDPALWLGRSGLPETTLMLAMLHRGDWIAVVDRLVGRDAEPIPAATIELLIARRWIDVLGAYLPPEAPPVDPSSTPASVVGQLLNLRAWAASHRTTPMKAAIPPRAQ
ncbi:MAG: hypothetical protein AAFX76_10655 [Planctomycetota bacterium]